MFFNISVLLSLLFLFAGCGRGVGTSDTTPPQFTSVSAISVQENQKRILQVETNDTSTVVYAIADSGDMDAFSLENSSGTLSFKSEPDYENPIDEDHDNIYHIEINATDSYGNRATQSLTISVIDVDEIPPHISSASHVTLQENHSKVIELEIDNNESFITYHIVGGEDASRFYIYNNNPILRFRTDPNFELPVDTGADNIYKVTVSIVDGNGNHTEQNLSVTVTDIDESSTADSDSDYIPDNIEVLLGTDMNNGDSNSNAIDDGLDTEGNNSDPFFDKQWHIRSLGTTVNDSGVSTIVGNDLDIVYIYHQYMGYNHGENIIVQVVDTGVDADHEDLIDNMDMSRSYNRGNIGDPSGNHEHGTMVAGIMAARAFNGKGVRGIAPFAKIAGSNWLNTQSNSALEKIWLSGSGANEIAVSNNSWGSYYDVDTVYEDIMELGTSTLRDGKGRVYVFAAGNDRDLNANANLQYILSSHYPITVAALKHDNTHADYSTPGSNILVSGYSGNYYIDSPTIGTTTIMGTSKNSGNIDTKTTWTEDTKHNYSFIMNGTSAAAPTVSASIALVLEACPNLTWRDVRYLAAIHAKQIDSSNSSWTTNAAGLHHSIDYGFGLIDPQAMITDCSAGYTLLPVEQSKSASKDYNNTTIPDNSSISFTLTMAEHISIEWVELTVDNDNPHASDYIITLTSPQGTHSILMTADSDVGGDWMNGGFRFSTAGMLDEDAQGDWGITLQDTISSHTGAVKDIGLKVYGH